MKPHVLIAETHLYAPLQEVFEFFSNAAHLNEVTPPELHFKFLTPMPIEMKVGATIDYLIRLSGIPIRWRTLITEWQPTVRFKDTQVRGPYALWEHEHYFEQREGYVYMRDTVHYLSPGWFLEPIIHHLFVKNKVESIFEHRKERFAALFGEHKA